MRKIFSVSFISLVILFSCGSNKEIVYKKIKFNDQVIELKNPFYKVNNVIYSDISEMSNYFGGKATFSGGDYTTSQVEMDCRLITFSIRTDIVSMANVITHETVDLKMEGKPISKDKGLDVPINGYVEILGFKHSIDNEYYVISTLK